MTSARSTIKSLCMHMITVYFAHAISCNTESQLHVREVITTSPERILQSVTHSLDAIDEHCTFGQVNDLYSVMRALSSWGQRGS